MCVTLHNRPIRFLHQWRNRSCGSASFSSEDTDWPAPTPNELFELFKLDGKDFRQQSGREFKMIRNFSNNSNLKLKQLLTQMQNFLLTV